MQKHIIIALLLVITSIALSAQVPPYHPYSEFNGNVGEYLLQNFENREINYIGKTVGELLSDVELQPIGYEFFVASRKSDGISLLIKIDLVFKRYKEGEFTPWYDDYLSIFFETPFPWSEMKNLWKRYEGNKWTIEDYSVVKDRKIRNVKYKAF